MSPKDIKLGTLAVPGSTADIMERVKVRSAVTTNPNERQTSWKQQQELLTQWQTRGLIPADNQPGPTKAHRRAVLDYEHEQCLHQLNVWREAEQKFIRVTRLILDLEYASLLTDSIHVVRIADLPVRVEFAEERRRGRETQKTEQEALQLRPLKIQVAERDTEACRNNTRRREEKLSEITIEPEKAGQTPPTVQTQVVQVQNQRRGGRRFRFEGCYCCSQMGHWSRDCPQHKMLQLLEHCTTQQQAPNNGPPHSYPRGGFHDYNRGRGSQGCQRGTGCPNMKKDILKSSHIEPYLSTQGGEVECYLKNHD